MNAPSKPVPWKKIVLVVGILLLLGAGALAGFVSLIFKAIRSSGAYTQALAKAQADPRVAAALGAPVEPGWYLTGSVQLQNDDGTAEIDVPLSGPKGGGTLHVEATKKAGTWTLEALELGTGSGDLDLLQSPEAP